MTLLAKPRWFRWWLRAELRRRRSLRPWYSLGTMLKHFYPLDALREHFFRDRPLLGLVPTGENVARPFKVCT